MSDHVYIRDRDTWRRWLTDNHTRDKGIWLVFDKGVGRRLSYDEIVDEALCVGWIDSKPGTVNAEQSKLWLAPRRPSSGWSRRNRERVGRLVEAGLMQPSGLEAVDAAKQSGTWNAIDAVEDLEQPDDLAVALDAVPNARAFWDAFPRSTRRAILEWISTAKRPETRAARVSETVEQASVNRRANQWRQPKSADRSVPPSSQK
jgi:uncharacterized protein YdeI (YjbR/CyaY-like superfamily)